MDAMSLREFLKKVEEEVKRKDEARQEIQAAMRKATRLSKQAIFLIHKERLEEAEEALKRAEEFFKKLEEVSKDDPELVYSGIVDAAFQEYSEARILLGLVRDGRFVGFEEIGVPTISYVLGLADVIGELRRRALDSIRRNKIEVAEDSLELMETIYSELIGLDEAHFLIHGLRKKCDIARRIIEATRGDVTMEARRITLERSIRELKDALKEVREYGDSSQPGGDT